MKLKTANQWLCEFPNSDTPEKIRCYIRQIQADAMRFSIEHIKSDPDIAFAIASIENLANELHPV